MPTATSLPTDLKSLTKQMRLDIIRMIEAAGNGHPGGSLSIIDILTVLYWNFLKHDPKKPDWEARDRFILSKGHACPALYAVMDLKDDLWNSAVRSQSDAQLLADLTIVPAVVWAALWTLVPSPRSE